MLTKARKLLLSIMTANPNGTPLSYLQSNGTQYIDTGIVGRSGLKVELKVKFIRPSVTAFLFGSRKALADSTFCLVTNMTKLRTDYNTSYSVSSSSDLDSTTEYTIIKDDNTTSVNGITIGTDTIATFSSGLNTYLFSCNSNKSASIMSTIVLYYCKIYDEKDVLLRDFVPMLKDDIPCLYDNVSGNYFYNKGTGSFTYA